MSAEIETMMYVGEVPWHKLGVYVGDENVDSKKAIETASLNWAVNKHKLFTSIDGVNPIEIEDKKAMVRSSDNKVLGVVGNRYEPLQNLEAFEFADSLVEAGKMKYHTAGSLRGGQIVWLLGKIGETEIVPNDKVDQYLFLYNTHDGSSALRVLFTTIRVVCANTAALALSKAEGEGLRVLHTRNMKERMAEANRILGISKQKFDSFTEITKKLADFRMKDDVFEDFTKILLPDPPTTDATKKIISMRQKQRDKLTELFHDGTGQDIPGVTGTGWAAFSAVTEYNNYFKRANGDNKDASRIESVMFGPSMHLTNRALTELQKIAA